MTSSHDDGARLGDLVAIRPDSGRVDRMWGQVAPRLERRAPFVPWSVARWGVAVALVALGLLIGRVVAPRPAPDAWFRGTTLQSAGANQSLRLPEGTAVELVGSTRVQIVAWEAGVAELALDEGEIGLDVDHDAGRKWTIRAGAYLVRVVGTKFRVRRELAPSGERVTVDVVRGRVEVAAADAPGDVRPIGAGESWKSPSIPAARAVVEGAAGEVAPSAASEVAPAEPPATASASASALPSVPSIPAPNPDASAQVPSARGWEELAKARKPREAWDALGGAQGFANATQAASAEKLLKLAQLAVASGHLREAAKAFDAIRTRHRSDARAGLAAFELGRLRQDSFGDAAGAAEALGDAIALGGPFREDAEARRVHALHASGATAACVAARDAYLARYPRGAHVGAVRARCTR